MDAAQILESCAPETDPDRRGAQVLLAVARWLRPEADLPELVVFAAHLDQHVAALDPAMVSDVARYMGIG